MEPEEVAARRISNLRRSALIGILVAASACRNAGNDPASGSGADRNGDASAADSTAPRTGATDVDGSAGAGGRSAETDGGETISAGAGGVGSSASTGQGGDGTQAAGGNGARHDGGANGGSANGGSHGHGPAGGSAAGGRQVGGSSTNAGGSGAGGHIDGGAPGRGGADSGTSSSMQPRFIGRVDASDPAKVKFAWSGTGLVATVQGTKISVRLQTEGGTPAFFQPVIDGNLGDRFEVPTGTRTVVLAQGLSFGDHEVELYRETEGMYGDSVFQGFVDGTIVGMTLGPGRLVEVIGDSISAGYGDLGHEVHPPWDSSCHFTPDTQSAYQSYGWILARALGAEASILALSGWGMYRDASGDTSAVLPSVYANTLGTQSTPTWDFRRKPDAVIINLGDNDSADSAGGDPGKDFEDAYVAFLRTVRGHYTNAWIFVTIGTMTDDPALTEMRAHINAVVTRFGDSKVTAIDLDLQDTSSTGCDWHPNVAEHQRIAGILAPVVKAKLGW